MIAPRGLSREEAALWERVAATVEPLKGRKTAKADDTGTVGQVSAPAKPHIQRRAVTASTGPVEPQPIAAVKAPRPLDRHGLDSSWERKLARGIVEPDFSLDLHGHTLDTAHARLELGLAQAIAQGARVVLLITGRPRPSSAGHAGHGERRGVIRAQFLDWLATGPHASRIAAVRQAQPRHGGAGAVYIVLRRNR